MKKIIAINCSPRPTWNTATLVREAAKGAEPMKDWTVYRIAGETLTKLAE